MKIIVAGSRTINDKSFVAKAMQRMIAEGHELVCGMARGVDLIARDVALAHGLIVHEYPATWTRDGKLDRSAGYKRNLAMAEVADGLLAIWDGESRGTRHMVEIMRKIGKPVRIVRV